MRKAIVLTAALVAHVASHDASAQSPRAPQWTINPTPIVRLGAENGSTDLFDDVRGATRLANGDIMIGDRGTPALRRYSPTGKFMAGYGRNGEGPGEFVELDWMRRCGDRLIASDVRAGRMSEFKLDGSFVRVFQFTKPSAGQSAYFTACGAQAFAHYGWSFPSPGKKRKLGMVRDSAPFWISPDNKRVINLGRMPGSERFATEHGDRPQPLGRQPRIAIGFDRIYIGLASAYDIMVLDMNGKKVGNLHKPNVSLAVTRADTEAEKARDMVGWGKLWIGTLKKDYADMTFPKQFPAYRNLLVDSEDNLWVEDYPRARERDVLWTVFTKTGAQLTEVRLPNNLDVYEIGKDYILARYMDPGESIPEVRMYRLNRKN